MKTKGYINPQWHAPSNIKAYTSTRQLNPQPHNGFAHFNLAAHVDDDLKTVNKNRQQLREDLQLPSEPIWLNQTHSTIAINVTPHSPLQTADASYSNQKNTVCAVLTADCLPILLCNQQGTEVAAIHGGWRGLVNGIIPATLQHFTCPPEDIMAWLGPAISVEQYQVGQTLRQQILDQHPDYASAFKQINDNWNLDLCALAKLQLSSHRICDITNSQQCTFSDEQRFYSYRRQGKQSGRIASLIWL